MHEISYQNGEVETLRLHSVSPVSLKLNALVSALMAPLGTNMDAPEL